MRRFDCETASCVLRWSAITIASCSVSPTNGCWFTPTRSGFGAAETGAESWVPRFGTAGSTGGSGGGGSPAPRMFAPGACAPGGATPFGAFPPAGPAAPPAPVAPAPVVPPPVVPGAVAPGIVIPGLVVPGCCGTVAGVVVPGCVVVGAVCGGDPTVVDCGAAPGVVTGCGWPCSCPGAPDVPGCVVVGCVVPGCVVPCCVVPGCGGAVGCVIGPAVGCAAGAGLGCVAGVCADAVAVTNGAAASVALSASARERENNTVLLDLDRRLDRHPDAQRLVRGRIVDEDAHRDALRHLHEVARRVLRRDEAERVLRRRRDRGHVPVERGALVGVDRDVDGLSDAHVAELRLFVVRGDVRAGDRHDRHERLPRRNGGADLDVLLADDPVDRRADHRVAEPVFGRLELRAQRARLSRRRARLGLRRRNTIRVVALGELALSGLKLPLLRADPGRRGVRRCERRGVAG